MKKSELKNVIKSIMREEVANTTGNIEGYDAPFGSKVRRGKKKKAKKKLNLPAPGLSKIVDGK